VLLKWILNVLLGIALYRIVRGLLRPSSRREVGSRSDRSLDPDRAVPARWSEVRDEEGSGQR
jgi:hypothetical protein